MENSNDVLHNVEALDVASYLVLMYKRKYGREIHKGLLNSLLYYCQKYHLAWLRVPLFKDDLQAWAYGPTVKSVNDACGSEHLITRLPGNTRHIRGKSKILIDYMLDQLGTLSPDQVKYRISLEADYKEALLAGYSTPIKVSPKSSHDI